MTETLWWFSFRDPKRPEGEQSLGVILTRGATFLEALAGTHVMGINPGGEVLTSRIHEPDWFVFPWKQYADRLLTRDEVEALDEHLRKALSEQLS